MPWPAAQAKKNTNLAPPGLLGRTLDSRQFRQDSGALRPWLRKAAGSWQDGSKSKPETGTAAKVWARFAPTAGPALSRSLCSRNSYLLTSAGNGTTDFNNGGAVPDAH